MVKVNVTYQTISAESAQNGDFSDQGFENEGLEFDTIDEAFKWFGTNYGIFEQVNDDTYQTCDANFDYYSGDETWYCLHIDTTN